MSGKKIKFMNSEIKNISSTTEFLSLKQKFEYELIMMENLFHIV